MIRNKGKTTRIAFLSEHASPVALLGGEDAGGQNVYVDEVTRHLARRGYAIDVFTHRDDPALPEIIDWGPGVRVINLDAGPIAHIPKDELWPYMPAFRDACLRFMERDEIHYDLIHGNFWMSGWVATELQQRLRIPATQIFHALGVTKRLHQGRADTSPRERIAVERQIVRDIDSVIATCPSEQEELFDSYEADPTRMSLIPLAANTEIFRPVEHAKARHIIKQPESDFTIVYVGRILPRKDVRNVVRALAQLVHRCEDMMPRPSLKLLIVGGETPEPDPIATPEIGELQCLAAELGVLDYVHFCGEQPQDRLRYYYSAGDVVVTTPWYEPFGLTPLEGMACARPVIGSDVGGISYTIIHGKTGFLVPPRDPAALAEQLYPLLTLPALRVRIGKAARMRVEHEFTWSTVAQRTAALYETLLVRQSRAIRSVFIDSYLSSSIDIPGLSGGGE
jgi:glycosyltransferase involved in cell wall biosynthesis